jgi:hypothetical protein
LTGILFSRAAQTISPAPLSEVSRIAVPAAAAARSTRYGISEPYPGYFVPMI